MKNVADQLTQYINLDYPLVEVTEVISTTSNIGRLFITGAQFASQKRFELFLKGLNNGEEISEIQLVKLKDYVSNEKRAQFICEQFDKVIRSNSVKASMMMGVILHDTVNKNEDPSLQKLITINALSQLYDEDINNLEYIYERFFQGFRNKITLYEESYDRQMWVKYFQRNTQHSSGLEYTFEKSMSLQLFKEENDTAKARMHEAYGFFEKPEFALEITSPGKEILRLVKIINEYK